MHAYGGGSEHHFCVMYFWWYTTGYASGHILKVGTAQVGQKFQ